MLALLTNLARAAAFYFQIRAVRAYWDLVQDIEKYIQDHEAQIASLRRAGDPASQLLADKLSRQLERANGIATDVSAARAQAEQGSANPDQGRGVSTPN